MISSDEWLIRKIKRGDDFAINKFVEKYYPIILNYCKKRVRDWGMAEDLTQETFVHFFRSLSLYRHHGKTQNYLYTIAGNLCRDFYKTNKEEIPMEETDLTGIRLSGMAQNGKLSYDPLEDAAERMDMQMALDKLPDIYREIMKLHLLYNLQQIQIAEILNIKIHIVKYRIKKGKILLQKILREEEFYDGV